MKTNSVPWHLIILRTEYVVEEKRKKYNSKRNKAMKIMDDPEYKHWTVESICMVITVMQ